MWKEISHLGFLEFLLGAAPPSPDPPELDPAAWVSISPTAKKRLYLPPKTNLAKIAGRPHREPKQARRNERRPQLPCLKICWRVEGDSGERSRRRKSWGPAGRLAKVTRKGEERFDFEKRRVGEGGRWWSWSWSCPPR